MSIMTFPIDIFSGASCFHVALIVFMRCYSILNPTGFRKMHSRLSRISIPIIWIFLTVVILVPTIISTNMLTEETMEKYKNLYSMSWQVVYHATVTLPVSLIILLFSVQLGILKIKRNQVESLAVSSKMKSLEKMIHMTTVGTLICYTPFIIWIQWSMIVISQGSTDLFDSTEKVNFHIEVDVYKQNMNL